MLMNIRGNDRRSTGRQCRVSGLQMRLGEKDAAVRRAEKAEAGEAQLLQRLELDQAQQADRMNNVMQMCEQMVRATCPLPSIPREPLHRIRKGGSIC